jgi:hypothetical protein
MLILCALITPFGVSNRRGWCLFLTVQVGFIQQIGLGSYGTSRQDRHSLFPSEVRRLEPIH